MFNRYKRTFFDGKCNGRGRAQVMCMLQGWTRSAYRDTRTTTRVKNIFQSRTIVCYTRARVKREEKGILQHQTTSLYIQLHLLPSNHPSCFDVSSKSSFVILPTISQCLLKTLTPQHPTSQHFFLHPHLILIILYNSHTITDSLRSSRTFVPAVL